MGVNHGWCPVAVRGAVLRPEGQGLGAKTNGDIVELQPRNAKYNWIVAELCDEHRQGLLMFEYCEVSVGNVRNITRGYRVAVDDLEASWILKGWKWESVMAYEIFIYESDSRSSAVDKGVGGNGPVAEGDIA